MTKRQPETALDLRRFLHDQGLHVHKVSWGRYGHWIVLSQSPKKPCVPGKCLKIDLRALAVDDFV